MASVECSAVASLNSTMIQPEAWLYSADAAECPHMRGFAFWREARRMRREPKNFPPGKSSYGNSRLKFTVFL